MRIIESKEGKVTRKRELLHPTNIYEEALLRYEELSNVVREKEMEIAKAPEGKIHIIRSARRDQYYLRKNAKDVSGEYLRRSDIAKVMIYLQKYYDEKICKLLRKEMLNLERFLKDANKYNGLIKKAYSSNSEETKKLIDPLDMSDEDYAKRWLQFAYVGKEIIGETPVWITEKGERVRSKSELNIANALSKYSVPYRYECPIKLKNGIILYPDFTVLNVRKRKTYYWEHRGMMDDREYAMHAVRRTKDMAKSGIILGNNLIHTEETIGCSLGTDEIKGVIEKFLL